MTRAAPERKRNPKAPRQPKVSEQQVVDAIRSRLVLFGVLCQPNPNEARSAAAGRAVKIRGTIAGFPDLTVISSDGRTAYFEVKTPTAKPRNAKDAAHWQRQAETQAMLRRMGHDVAVVRSQDEAVQVLQAWGWPVR
jgi:hypothetical protein